MKLKTHKAMAKRFRVTKSGKIMKKANGQDHFNSREPGSVTRSKRRLKSVFKTSQKTIKASLPYA